MALALFALLLAAGGALWCLAERQSALQGESQRLAAQAATVEANVARLLRGTLAGLQAVRRELPRWAPGEREAFAERRLAALRGTMTGVVSLQWRGADGRLLADSEPGHDRGDGPPGPAFALAQARPDPEVWLAAPPHEASAENWRLELALPLVDGEGRFAGALLASLDRSYFDDLLASVLYAADMRAQVLHGEGRVAAAVPGAARLEGGDVSRAGAPYARHLASGRAASVQIAPSPTRDAEVLAAFHTLRAESLGMQPPLVLVVSRTTAQTLAAWRQQTAWFAALLGAGLLAAALLLRGLQRERGRDAANAERLSLALRGGDLALWDADLVADRSVVNERWSTMLGYQPGDVPADSAGWQSLIHPDDRERVLAAQDAHLAGRTEAYEATYRLRHRDGHHVWVQDRGRVLQRAGDGRPLRMVGTHLDVTAAVEAADTLRRSEQSLAITLQSIGDGVIATDAAGVITRINPAACQLTGWAAEAAIGRPLAEVFRIHNAQTGEPGLDPVARVLARGGVVELANGTVLTALDGRQSQIADSAAPIRAPGGEIQGVVLVFSDVTEQYRMLEALRQSEQKSRALLAALQSGVVVHALDGRIVEANPAAARFLGFAPGTGPGLDPLHLPWQLLDEDGSPIAPERYPANRVLATGLPLAGLVIGLRRAGQEHPSWALCTAFPLRTVDGALHEVVVTFSDFTARKVAEEAQRQAQDELAATLAALPDLLFEIDGEGHILNAHAPRADALALPVERQIGRRVEQALPAEAAALVRRVVGEALVAGRASGPPYALDTPQGRRWFETTAARRQVGAGEAPRCVLLARDVTDRVRAEQQRELLERQVREAQRIESLGTLAGGIAHDFNNILAAILGNASLARDALPAGHEVLDSLDRIHQAGLRARSLVQQILAFSRRDPAQLRPMPLQPVVEETVTLLRATLPATVRLEVDLPAAPLVAEADATQLQQVLMNLCTNAWHALPEARGRIEIGLAEAAGDPRLPEGDLRRQRHVHLWVRDDGCGMDAATRERLFNPFFTTKPVGQGTGLGLSVAHGIVRQHGGLIDVDTAPGAGSIFHVHLPPAGRVAAAAGAALAVVAPGAPAAPPAATGGGRHALVLDDDEVMAITSQALLERAGWRVTCCNSPGEALARLAEGGERVDVVISDHNMPEMSGTEFARRVRLQHPALPLVISSGYLSDELRQQAAAAGVNALLHKEHTLEQLVALADEVAAQGGGPAQAAS